MVWRNGFLEYLPGQAGDLHRHFGPTVSTVELVLYRELCGVPLGLTVS